MKGLCVKKYGSLSAGDVIHAIDGSEDPSLVKRGSVVIRVDEEVRNVEIMSPSGDVEVMHCRYDARFVVHADGEP